MPPGCTAAPIQLARTPGGVSSGTGSAPWTRARESIACPPPSSLMSNLLGARACETRGRYHYQHRSEFCLGPRIVHFLLALRLLSSPTPRALQHTAMAHASGAELMDKTTFQAFLEEKLQEDWEDHDGRMAKSIRPYLLANKTNCRKKCCFGDLAAHVSGAAAQRAQDATAAQDSDAEDVVPVKNNISYQFYFGRNKLPASGVFPVWRRDEGNIKKNKDVAG